MADRRHRGRFAPVIAVQQTSLNLNGALDHHTLVRSRFEIGPTATFQDKTVVRVRFAHLGLDDNHVSNNRSDNQLNVTVSRRF